MKEKIQELFQEYGTLKTIKKIKQPKQKKITIYGYSFEMSNLFEEAQDTTIDFLIVDQEQLVSLVYFGISHEILDTENMLEQLNYANTKMLYGKFLVDDDNDAYWEHSFEPSRSSKEEILAIIKGFVNGLEVLFKWKKDDSNEE